MAAGRCAGMNTPLITAHVSEGKTQLPGDWESMKMNPCKRDVSELEIQALWAGGGFFL